MRPTISVALILIGLLLFVFPVFCEDSTSEGPPKHPSILHSMAPCYVNQTWFNNLMTPYGGTIGTGGFGEPDFPYETREIGEPTWCTPSVFSFEVQAGGEFFFVTHTYPKTDSVGHWRWGGRYLPNYSGVPRTAQIRFTYTSINGQPATRDATITQAATCVYDLNWPDDPLLFGTNGGTITSTIIKSPQCTNLSVSSGNPWITVTLLANAAVRVETTALPPGVSRRDGVFTLGTKVFAVKQYEDVERVPYTRMSPVHNFKQQNCLPGSPNFHCTAAIGVRG